MIRGIFIGIGVVICLVLIVWGVMYLLAKGMSDTP